MFKNSEGYHDPTAGMAYKSIRREKHKKDADRLAAISTLIPIIKRAAALAGFEVVGRIVLRDRTTGKEYR